MALLVKTGEFNKNTGAQPVDDIISGVGFTPKLVILQTSDVTTVDTFTNDASMAFGAASGSAVANMRSFALTGQDNVSTSEDNRRWTSKLLTVIGNTGSLLYECDLKTFDADGFTVTWTTNDARATKIQYTAFGGTGSDLTNVKVGEVALTATAGSQGYTGVTFQPDFLIFYGCNVTALGNAAMAKYSFGCASGPANEWSNSIIWRDAQPAATASSLSFSNDDFCYHFLSIILNVSS